MSYLTERQKEILEYIQGYRRERGIAPTHREICEKFGFSSYGTAYKHLKLLQQKGFLKRDWNQKRGIELIRAIPGNESSERDLPYFGRIAAGRPIEALSGNDRVTVPGHLLSPRGGDHYVLRVVGEDATLKRFYPEGAVVRLQPANPTMQPIRVPARDVKVQGVVVGLMRKF